MNKGITALVIILAILIIIAGALLAIKIVKDQNGNSSYTYNNFISLGKDTGKTNKVENSIKIYNGVERPIAVMIDNHKSAWPQANLNEAYAVYEIIVEGGETRLMVLYKGKNLDKIGPVRSARHYFLDYALENDAIYVHFGWSPQAESDISKYSVNNINGILESDKNFWRVKDKKAPHNVVTDTNKILQIANSKKYRTTSNAKSVLTYKAEEINLNDGIDANSIEIPYSTDNTISYKYNSQTKRYERYAKNTKQTDWVTGEIVTTKNIIITFAENYTLNDGENKDRQGLRNVGENDGYYITNGKAIKIKCIKSSRTSKTIYKDLEGNEISVNDGNTFFQICPLNAKVVIE